MVVGRRSTARDCSSPFILLVLQVCSGCLSRINCYGNEIKLCKSLTCIISLRDDGHHTWQRTEWLHKVRHLPGVVGLVAWQFARCHLLWCTLSVCMLLTGQRQSEGRLYLACWNWRRGKVASFMMYPVRLHASRWSASKWRATKFNHTVSANHRVGETPGRPIVHKAVRSLYGLIVLKGFSAENKRIIIKLKILTSFSISRALILIYRFLQFSLSNNYF